MVVAGPDQESVSWSVRRGIQGWLSCGGCGQRRLNLVLPSYNKWYDDTNTNENDWEMIIYSMWFISRINKSLRIKQMKTITASVWKWFTEKYFVYSNFNLSNIPLGLGMRSMKHDIQSIHSLRHQLLCQLYQPLHHWQFKRIFLQINITHKSNMKNSQDGG